MHVINLYSVSQLITAIIAFNFLSKAKNRVTRFYFHNLKVREIDMEGLGLGHNTNARATLEQNTLSF